MDDLQHQFDLLNATNKKLSSDGKVLEMICNTSSSAFLYYSFEDNIIKTLGNWEFFFHVKIQKLKDISKIYHCVEDKYILILRDMLFIEKKGIKSNSIIVCLQDSKTWVECEANISYDEDGKPKEKVIRFKDITKFKSQNDELTYMSYYDMLTGLYNRNYFVRLLGDFVLRAEEEKTGVAVMFIDIDDFRKINDGYGIIVGDVMVQQFGQYISTFKNNYTIISHFNSDIYCIAIYDPRGARSVEHIYRMIHERLKKPFILSTGQELSISVSIGVAKYPEAALTALDLINCAEIVMFNAKSSGKNSIKYFDVPIFKDFLNVITIENKLKEATLNQNFMMYFQPQYNAIDKRLRGLEALIRWKDDDGNMISPAVFIPIAEKNGTIVSIGTWVIEESVRIYSEWKKNYKSNLILSLNISAIQYKRADFVSILLQILKKYDVNPTEVELEITESVLIDDFVEITDRLAVLRNCGVRISLDDFGTGYSSLSYLKGLPIDTLKIDKSFIDTVVSDSNTRIIMESIIYMVKKLGFETVAEGVETKEQYDYLKSIHCDNIQGYFLGKPMPSYEIEELLKQAVI